MESTAEKPMTVQKIPLAKIMPNPRQPRRSFREGSIQEMADSLKANGQDTPIKVRPLTPEELKLYAPFEFMVIGGHRRRAGAELAGLEALDCIVRDIPPLAARFAALRDNNQDDMDWWDWDVEIYDLHKGPPEIRQNVLAQALDKSPTKINFAIKIGRALTPTAREAIDRNLGKAPLPEGAKILPQNSKNKGFLITESILLALADLDDPQKVEAALRDVLDNHMDEPQVREMVKGLQAVGDPMASGLDGQEAPLTLPISPKTPIGEVPYVPSKPRQGARGRNKAQDYPRPPGPFLPGQLKPADRIKALLVPPYSRP